MPKDGAWITDIQKLLVHRLKYWIHNVLTEPHYTKIAYVRVHINILAPAPDIAPVMVPYVIVNIQNVIALAYTIGQEALAYIRIVILVQADTQHQVPE